MRQARAVSVRCPGRGPWLLVQAGLFALAATVAAAWVLAWWAPSAVPLALAFGAGGAAWGLRAGHRPDALLQWTGSAWRFGDEPMRAAEVMLDLGAAVLLRLRPASAKRRAEWVLVTAAQAGAEFRPLCAALHGGRP